MAPPREILKADYDRIRATTMSLCEPLAVEDYVVQSMPDASPTRWHLAHTTWFFETFVLAAGRPSYAPFHPAFAVLFNSYYQAVGPQFPRSRRGVLTRPTVAEVRDYRAHVDRAMDALFRDLPRAAFAEIAARVELGLQHEEQHQELIVTDLKHMLAQNPIDPVYLARAVAPPPDPSLVARGGAAQRPSPAAAPPDRPSCTEPIPPSRGGGFGPAHSGGVLEIGTLGEGFSFDNEGPRHKVWAEPFQLGRRLVTAGEYRDFVEDGGYSQPDLWLSEGFAAVRAEGWEAPLYWRRDDDGAWSMMTLAGRRPVDADEPVCHVSYYEADAYARWAGARLPREDEWEIVAATAPIQGNFLEDRVFHTAPAGASRGLSAGPSAAVSAEGDRATPEQLFGDAWEWTASAYLAYPGFAPLPGALGEYNGKFMSGQMVLRGGSCATPAKHIRPTYRNFFPPSSRWQFSGFRLAR